MNKKKIAVLGSSPSMLMLAKKLSDDNVVHVYEKRKKIGGAWKIYKYKNLNFQAHTNIVASLHPKDEKYYKLINKTLSFKYGVKIKRNSKSCAVGGWEVKKRSTHKVFEYYFGNFFEKMRKSLKIKKKKISKIKIHNKGIYIEKMYYDKLYITAFSGIENIISNKKKKIHIPFDYRKSTHFILVAKKEFIKNFHYSDNFSDIFDRAQLKKVKKFYVFTSRIKKKFKKERIEKILNFSDFDLEKKDILLAKKINFNNHYRTPVQIKKMINDLKFFKQIKVIDTSQLFYTYKKEILNV